MKNGKVPAGLGTRGRAFWRDTVADYELSRGELELLVEACRALDQCDALRAAVDADGYTVRGSEGQPRVHPAISQLNATRTLLGRLLAQLDLPDPDGESMPSQATIRARKAAQGRWAGHNAAKAAGEAKIAELRRHHGSA